MSAHRIVMTLGASLVATVDPLERLNPGGAEPLRHWQVEVTRSPYPQARGSTILGAAAIPAYENLAEVVPAADGTLSGRLYSWSWGLSPDGVPIPALVTGVGVSASVSWVFDERHAGLWLLTCWRSGHGAYAMPLEVVLRG